MVVRGDSNLVIQQIRGDYGAKEVGLAKYRARDLELAKVFV